MTYLIALCIALTPWIQVPGDKWQPTHQQLHELKQLLKPYVEEQAIAWREDLPPWKRYTFQFQAQLIDGNKVIFINAMCSEPPSQVTRAFVYTFDGGPCYFRVHWNPTSKTFTGFSFNGYG